MVTSTCTNQLHLLDSSTHIIQYCKQICLPQLYAHLLGDDRQLFCDTGSMAFVRNNMLSQNTYRISIPGQKLKKTTAPQAAPTLARTSLEVRCTDPFPQIRNDQFPHAVPRKTTPVFPSLHWQLIAIFHAWESIWIQFSNICWQLYNCATCMYPRGFHATIETSKLSMWQRY